MDLVGPMVMTQPVVPSAAVILTELRASMSMCLLDAGDGFRRISEAV
jgi:hypothetical protein